MNASFGTWLTSRSKEDWKIQNTSCPFTSQTMYFFGTSPNPTDWNQQTNWYTDVLHKTPITLKSRPDGADNAIILTDVSRNTGLPAVVKTLQVRDSTISIPISNTVGTALATQMP